MSKGFMRRSAASKSTLRKLDKILARGERGVRRQLIAADRRNLKGGLYAL
jgi:hypothetical protein